MALKKSDSFIQEELIVKRKPWYKRWWAITLFVLIGWSLLLNFIIEPEYNDFYPSNSEDTTASDSNIIVLNNPQTSGSNTIPKKETYNPFSITGLIYSESDISICDSYDENQADTCISGFAFDSGSSSICKQVKDDLNKIDCYLALALKNKDYSLCGSITRSGSSISKCELEKEDKYFCSLNVKNLAPKECVNTCYEEYYADECYSELIDPYYDIPAITDSNVCSEITDKEKQYSCYEKLAILEQDSSICDYQRNDNLALISKAMFNRDESICSELSGDYAEDNSYEGICYRKLAFLKDDESLCSDISSGDINRDVCSKYFECQRNSDGKSFSMCYY